MEYMRKHIIELKRFVEMTPGGDDWVYFCNDDASESHFLPTKTWEQMGKPDSLSFAIIGTDLGET